MTYVTFIQILLWSILICFIIAALVHGGWLLLHKAQRRPTILRFIMGQSIMSVCSGLTITLILYFFLLPTAHVVGSDGYEEKLFISSEWPSQLTNDYIDNQSGHTLILHAVGYGTSQNVDKSIIIPIGAFVECEHSISGYNVDPPLSITSKSSGVVEWYLFTEDVFMEYIR